MSRWFEVWQVRIGKLRIVVAWFVMAYFGQAGGARSDMVCQGLVGLFLIWQVGCVQARIVLVGLGVAGEVWFGDVGHGKVRCGIVGQSEVWLVWRGLIWSVKLEYGEAG